MAELQAENMDVAEYNKSAFQNAVLAIRGLTTLKPNSFVDKVVELCGQTGVAICLVEEVPIAKISGAAKWLSPTKAMIALDLRGKKNDRFWFAFFHEAGHILLDSKKTASVEVSYSDDPREHAANEFARTTLIPASYN